jgi:hypothetical protein
LASNVHLTLQQHFFFALCVHVRDLIFEGRRCVGVRAFVDGELREFRELSNERSRVTDAIDRRIKELEAPPVAGDDHAARYDELRRLRKTLLAELEKTSAITNAKQAEHEERKRLAEAPRRKLIAEAALAWQRKRRIVLAYGFAATALAGWLLWQAHVRHRPQALF